jgi:hypothetical protein
MAERRTGLSHEDLAVTRMIADRVSRGHTLVEISRTTRIARKRLAKLARAAGIRYKHQHPSPQLVETAIRAVVDLGMTYRAAAKAHGISRTAVHRFVQRRREKFVDTAGDLKIESREWKCSIHGRLKVWPCVACEALKSRNSEKQNG